MARVETYKVIDEWQLSNWLNTKLRPWQVYNYGKRLLFDVVVPAPSNDFILNQTNASHKPEASLVPPVPFTATADQIQPWNYMAYAGKYQATGLEAPPEPYKTVTKAIDGTSTDGDHLISKSDTLVVDDGYSAKYVQVQRAWTGYDDRHAVVR